MGKRAKPKVNIFPISHDFQITLEGVSHNAILYGLIQLFFSNTQRLSVQHIERTIFQTKSHSSTTWYFFFPPPNKKNGEEFSFSPFLQFKSCQQYSIYSFLTGKGDGFISSHRPQRRIAIWGDPYIRRRNPLAEAQGVNWVFRIGQIRGIKKSSKTETQNDVYGN